MSEPRFTPGCLVVIDATEADWRAWQDALDAERAAMLCVVARERWRRCRWWTPQPHMSGPLACRAPEGPVCCVARGECGRAR